MIEDTQYHNVPMGDILLPDRPPAMGKAKMISW